MRISDWSSDVCSSDLERSMAATVMGCALALERNPAVAGYIRTAPFDVCAHGWRWENHSLLDETTERERIAKTVESFERTIGIRPEGWYCRYAPSIATRRLLVERSEEHTSELQSLMRISYAVFCLKKKNTTTRKHHAS